MRTIELEKFAIGKGLPLAVISGPCVIESEEHCLSAAYALAEIFSSAEVPLIFKASYDKANRSSLSSFRGPGLAEGLKILERVRREVKIPTLTDVHSPEEARLAGSICDIIQIPAFLCRQTDLLVAAAETPAIVNIKKGQFMAPWDMKNVVDKVVKSGNDRVILTDRGTSFGYNNLVSDMRAIMAMQQLDVVVCFDATHSVQLPGSQGDSSGGERQYIPLLAKAAVAAGADLIFMESHPNPSNAKSDKDSVIDFTDLPPLLKVLKKLHSAVNSC